MSDTFQAVPDGVQMVFQKWSGGRWRDVGYARTLEGINRLLPWYPCELPPIPDYIQQEPAPQLKYGRYTRLA